MNVFTVAYATFISMTCYGCAATSVDTDKTSHVAATSKSSSIDGGQKVLRTGNTMIIKKEIIRGGCWDYINAVYNRSGYPQSKRRYVLKGKKNSGPYAKPEQIKPGDWLYHINHSYKGVGHSGIFVRWIDKKKRIGETLSYRGESHKTPGRYRKYDLSHVYTIIRPRD